MINMEGTLTKNKQVIWAMVFIIALTWISFLPSLRNGFTNWDDPHMVVSNTMIRSLSPENIVGVFSSFHYAHYHPLVVLSFAVEYAIAGLDPMPYHLTNLLLHTINALLVFWLVRALNGNLVVSSVTALLFAIHPLRVESVAWVTERKDVLYSMFFLSAMVVYVRYVQTRYLRHFFLVLLLFLLALLSKSMAVTLPFVLLLLDYYLGRKFERGVFLEKIPMLGLSLLFAFLILYASYPARSHLEGALFNLDNVFVAAHGVLFYLYKVVNPSSLSALYPYPVKYGEMLPMEYLLAPIPVAVLIGFALFSMRNTKILAFGFFFFLLTLLPVSQLARIGGVIAADRFVYLPLIGIFFLIGEAVDFALRKLQQYGQDGMARGVRGVVFAGILALAFLTWKRVQVWENSVTLWTDVLEQYPGVPVAYDHRGLGYADRRMYREALDDYNRGIALTEDDWRLYFHRGTLLKDAGEPKLAVADFTTALALYPSHAESYYYRGLSYHQLGQLEDALSDYSQAISLNRSVPEFFTNRGVVYSQKNELIKAVQDFSSALALFPKDGETFFNRGLAYALLGRSDEALADFSSATNYQPESAKNFIHRGILLSSKERYREALVDFTTAIYIDSLAADAYNGRGKVLYHLGELAMARADFLRALSLNPALTEVYANRAATLFRLGELYLARKDLAMADSLGVQVSYDVRQAILRGTIPAR